MWAEERQHRIMNLVATQGRIETDSLAQALNVSRETVRRDLMKLASEGKVRRVHGGVTAAELPPEKPFGARALVHAAEKQRIAKAAVRLLAPGQCCFIDAGTTTAAFARELATVCGIAVITNSLDVAEAIRSGQADADVVLLGGRMGADVPATYGELTLGQIERFRADFAIVSPVGIDPRHGATDYLMPEADVARAMIANAARVAILADRSKLGVVSRVKLCPCEGIDILVVDKGPHPLVGALRKAGIGEIIAA
jgi:DeoR family transcriptional regulator, fructose operon transcriptional repressor